MNKLERLMSITILGLLAPVVLMLTLWWGSLPLIKNNDKLISQLALTGLAIGLILNFTLLRGFVLKLFKLPLFALLILEIFYSIMIYGFFMGLPVFNSFVGIVGIYITTRLCIMQNYSRDKIIKNTNVIINISSLLLLICCVSTAFLALRESTICLQVKGMLALPFDVTMQMIWAIIIIGGALLLLFQYYTSKIIRTKILLKAQLQ